MLQADPSLSIPEIRRANKSEAAAFFDVSLKTIEAWSRSGMPVVVREKKSWLVDLLAAAQWRFGARQSSNQLDPEELPPQERKMWYDGEAKRRDIQIRDRELIPVVEVEEVIGTAYSAIAQALLSLPDNMERRAGLSAEQAEAAEQAIHESMSELADRLGRVAPVDAE